MKPFRRCLDSSFIAFSTARSIPRRPNPQATTTADKAATRRGCGSSADDGWSSLCESKEEEVPRDILRRTSASVATIEFDPGLDRLVDPFDKVHEEFAPVFEAASLSPRQEPILELCHPKIRTLRQEVFDL